MKAVGRYDGSLQMFVEEPREPDMARLEFLRWLVENRKFEHKPAGPPSGKYSPSGMCDPDEEWQIAS